MAKNNARKSFVAARLKETGKEATPEQRAKFRARFDLLSQTKQGRTTIAQKVLPQGTAAERATLKKSLRPTTTGSTTTGSTTTGSTTTGSTTKVNLAGVRDATPYRPTIISSGNTAKNNSQTSTVIARPNVYGDAFEEKVALKLEEWGIPIFGRVAGIGRAFDEGKTSSAVQKTVAASLEALITGASFGAVPIAGKTLASKFPTVGPTNQTRLRLDFRGTQKDLKKLSNQKFGQTPGDLMGHTTPGGIRAESSVQALQGRLGGLKDYPVASGKLRAHSGESGWATNQASGATGPAFYERNNPVYGPPKPTSVTAPKAPVTTTPKAPATTVPKTSTATTVPKTSTATTVPLSKMTAAQTKTSLDALVKTKADAAAKLKAKNDALAASTKAKVTSASSTPSPPPTTPRQYDNQGKGIGEPQDIRVGDPMPARPDKPIGLSKVKFNMSDQIIDYEVRLQNYYRYNKITPPKKK